jgi:predicted DNA-binding transcriptional regulator YafY
MAKKKPVATKPTGPRAPKPHPVSTRPEAQRRLRQADRLARILRLLQLIQRRGQRDAEAIARELECSVRTVYRDLTVLELAGVPWMFDKDTGGYRVRADYQFPVLQLTNEELIGQATATVTSKAAGLDVTEGAGPTSEKLAASSGKESEEILREAQRFIEVLDLKLADHSRHLDCVQTVQWALLTKKQLTGQYESPYESKPVKLTVHPYRLCLIKSAWYLIAKTAGEPEPRTYRIVRFKSLRMTDKPAVIPRGFDLRDYFGNAWGVYRGQDSHDVELLFAKEAAEVVSETVWHHTQKSKRHTDGSLTMTFTVDGLDEIVRWIVGWSGRVKVIAPEVLRDKVVEEHRRAIAANS